MRYGILILVLLLANCELSAAADPNSATASETEAKLKALVERLEARVAELETEVARMKRVQQRAVIGGSLLDHVEELNEQELTVYAVLIANGSTGSSAMRVDRTGIMRSRAGRPLGYGGIDFRTHDMQSGPNLNR